MPDRERRDQGPMRDPSHQVQPQRSPDGHPKHALPPGFGPRQVQSIGRLAGNKATQGLIGTKGTGAVQRVEVNLGNKTETMYERPNMRPGGVPIVNPKSGQKDFVATAYGMSPKYSMTRSAKMVDVEVRIQFLDQARGTNQWSKNKKTGKFLNDKAGNKVPDPTYTRNIGAIKTITDAARINFAKAQCNAISGIWSGNYKLVGKQVEVFGGVLDSVPLLGDAVRPNKAPIHLKLNFRAVPVFNTGASNVHTSVRLFGNKVVAKRSGAHPIDAGHWYMNTKANYGSTSITAISAHEYGHLLGLADEYSQSNDQVHQLLHQMGGKARKSAKALDAHTSRHMVAQALYPPIRAQMAANIAQAGGVIVSAQPTLQRQLATALRTVWRDGSIRSSMVKQLEPALTEPDAKNALKNVVAFQTGANFSNITLSKSSFGGLAAAAIKTAVMDEMRTWYRGVLNEVFQVEGADKTKTSFSANYSANLRQGAKAGPGTKAGAVVQSVAGTASVGVPRIPPSPTIISQLEGLPAFWKAPGNGIDAAYTPAVATTHIGNSVKTALAAKLFDGVKTPGALYRPVYNLVQSAAIKSAQQAVVDFVDKSVRQKVQTQLTALRGSIDTEIQAALGMTAGGAAVKSADPNMKAMAAKYLGMLQAQQNKKIWKQAALINPGAGSGDVDVRYTASSMMGGNNPNKSGFRTDMVAPVVAQFNARLKQFGESKFRAEKQ